MALDSMRRLTQPIQAVQWKGHARSAMCSPQVCTRAWLEACQYTSFGLVLYLNRLHHAAN